MGDLKGIYSNDYCTVVVFDPPKRYECGLLKSLAEAGLTAAVLRRSWKDGITDRVAYEVSVPPTDDRTLNEAWVTILTHHVGEALRFAGVGSWGLELGGSRLEDEREDDLDP